MTRPLKVLIVACLLAAGPMHAAFAASSQKGGSGPGSLLPGANSKDPININAGKLDYFDKEQKLIYTGDVVAKQGETTLRASVLTIFLTKQAKKDDGAAAPAAAAPSDAVPDPANAGSSVSRMIATGPVTVISKDNVGTGDNGVYDKAANTVTLTGHVTLTEGSSIVKGDTLVYDMTTAHANVSAEPTHRIISVFTPGSGKGGDLAGGKKTGGGKAEKAKAGSGKAVDIKTPAAKAAESTAPQ